MEKRGNPERWNSHLVGFFLPCIKSHLLKICFNSAFDDFVCNFLPDPYDGGHIGEKEGIYYSVQEID